MKASKMFRSCTLIALLTMTGATTAACSEEETGKSGSALETRDEDLDQARAEVADPPEWGGCPETSCTDVRPTCQAGETFVELNCMKVWASNRPTNECGWSLFCVTLEDDCTVADCTANRDKAGAKCKDGVKPEKVDRCARDEEGSCLLQYTCA